MNFLIGCSCAGVTRAICQRALRLFSLLTYYKLYSLPDQADRIGWRRDSRRQFGRHTDPAVERWNSSGSNSWTQDWLDPRTYNWCYSVVLRWTCWLTRLTEAASAAATRRLSRLVRLLLSTMFTAASKSAAAAAAAYVKCLRYPKSLGPRVIIVSITYTGHLTILGTSRPHTDFSRCYFRILRSVIFWFA